MKRPTSFCAGPTARRGCIRSLQTYDARIFISGKSFHEPPPHPACGHPLPAWRGEGRERGANLVHGPNACEKRKGAFHEPPLSRPAATLSPPCGERAGRGVPIWFMAPMRVQILEVPPAHEPPPLPPFGHPLHRGGGEGRGGDGVRGPLA